MNLKRIGGLTSILLCAAFFPSAAPAADEWTAVASGVQYQYLGAYDIARLNKIMTTERTEFSDFKADYPPARYPVKLYRIVYSSVIPERNNRPTVASGLLAVPETGNAAMPVVSYQHGTVFTKTAVPSHPEESMETRLTIARFAGQGYLVLAADYFGKGLSAEPDSYLVKAATQQACLDFLFAARAVSAELNITMGPLFLSGWSQGGWSTMVFLNKLESLNIPVKAAAVASAPVDLFAIINRWIHAPEAIDAVYLPGLIALQANAYEEYHQIPGLAAAVIKPEYQPAARDLYLNRIGWEEFRAKTPAKIGDFVRSDFVQSSSVGDHPYSQLLQAGQAYRWRGVTPIHSYYGGIDEVVPEYIAALPAGYQAIMGGAKATAVAAGPQADHRGTFVYGLLHQKDWFDTFLKPE
jgi:pimeloyl-ACP methyl ester carboxylesterase